MSDLSTSPDYIGWKLVIFTAVFIPLQTIAVLLRFYARRFVVGTKYTLEDALVLLSLVLQIILSSVGVATVPQAGVGYHVDYLKVHDPAKLFAWFKYLLAITVIYAFASVIPKLAILVLYHHVFATRKFRIMSWALAAFLVGQIVCNTIVLLAACRPFEANYNPIVPGATCINRELFFTWATLPNIVTDIIMLALPLPVVWGLHNTLRIKLGLTFTFLVGSSGLITSILRFQTFLHTDLFKDTTWDAVELIFWTLVEPGSYLISACLLSYRPLLERFTLLCPLGPRRGGHGRSQSTGYRTGRSGADGTGALPLTNRSTHTKGFKELDDDEAGSIDTSTLAFASHGNGVRHPRSGLITVTTDIENQWSER
ncbi:putative alpha-xylosidase [Westerdykella ornata]|uniref:Putative alpha-xylosidase n=1 Tax=Westerdykella ornata TaxID=318751 RepID=A0A6A6JLC8_WESOR|nr:putative alpha-xylosidase [Westerdykella ornata]KAF2277307.1 putative alpha-xylosidase [Westerdykella ornata]